MVTGERRYLTRKELAERFGLSPVVAGQWIEREVPEAVLRINRRVFRYDAEAVELLERRLRGCGELHERHWKLGWRGRRRTGTA